ncbi:MAG: hypothetical protein ACYCWW_07000 [Deltaproteobacteria bacterium]
MAGDRVELPRELRRRLSALPEGSIRDAAAVRELSSLEPGEAARALEGALWAARHGGPSAASVAWSLCEARGPESPLSYEQRADIYRAAREAGLVAAALLVAPTAWKVAPQGNPSAAGAGELSLGHRRAMARTLDPTKLDRLAADADAGVVRELLRNPKLAERHVLRIATRRPARRDVLETIARSPWARRPSVRTALARNPYCPPALGLRLLAHLPGTTLHDIANDGTLHPEIRRVAQALEAVPEPVPPGGAPSQSPK